MTHPKTGTNARPDIPLAVVIGAGGMGMAAARRLGERYRLLLVDIDEDRLRQKLGALREEGHDAISCACDITSRESVNALAVTVEAQGPLRVLAHVAGLSPSMADWQTIMRVNLMGCIMWPTRCCHLPARGLPRSSSHRSRVIWGPLTRP